MSKLHIARIAALGGYFCLMALLTYWHGWWFPSVYFPTALVLIVLVLPMLIPLRGLLHGRVRAHLWASFLMMLYFMHGVVEAYVNAAQRLPALLEVGLSLVVFVAAAYYTRWMRAANARQAEA